MNLWKKPGACPPGNKFYGENGLFRVEICCRGLNSGPERSLLLSPAMAALNANVFNSSLSLPVTNPDCPCARSGEPFIDAHIGPNEIG
jgi:hypothetical protein